MVDTIDIIYQYVKPSDKINDREAKMGLTALVLGVLGGIAAVLGILGILEIPSDPLISDKLTWMFWMYLSGILLLGSIAFLLGRKQNYED